MECTERNGGKMSLEKVIQAIVSDVPGLDIGVLITIDKGNCLSMVTATADGVTSPAADELLKRLCGALWPNGGGGTANKLPL
jgi:hypothetical protein